MVESDRKSFDHKTKTSSVSSSVGISERNLAFEIVEKTENSFFFKLKSIDFDFSLLERSATDKSNSIEVQEFFDIIVATSQNPVGRDIVWNFYRHFYPSLLTR